MYDFRKTNPSNPGLIIWDPVATAMPCSGRSMRATLDQFKYKCGKHEYDLAGVTRDNVKGCWQNVGSGDADVVMCTADNSKPPFCK